MIGTAVGPYRIVSRLGAGGMGEVFLGHDTRLHRQVALKCLTRLPPGTSGLRARVLSEARAAARLSHPHIAAIYDVVEQDGQSFIVMEYVSGESLASRLARGRLAPDAAMAVGRQLASAVAAAHAVGVIHRDLKPGNVQLTPDGSVKVLDFGIAKVAPEVGPTSAITVAGTVTAAPMAAMAGTPAYMSPEQLLNEPIDARSDLYSLGLILFEMAAGRPPFPERDPIGRAVAIASAPAPAADEVNPAVPRALAAIIAKALERRPADRYQSARELERALADMDAPREPTRAARILPPPAARPEPWRRGAAVLVGAPLIVGALGFANTAMFNAVLDRPAPFDRESVATIFVYGARSLVAPAVYLTMTAIVAGAVAFAVRMLRLVPPVDRALTTSGSRTRSAALRLRFDDPAVRAQAIAAAGAIALAVVVWYYRDLILAFTSQISEEPPARFAPLAAENARRKDLYGIVLDVLTAAFAIAVARAARLRARNGSGGTGALAVSAGVVFLLLLMNGLPYRVLWKNEFERVEFDGLRCYLIGESPSEWLMYCPDQAPPRTRVVGAADPAVARTGVVESIFTQAGP